jgi:hypothetical protein
LRLTPGKSMRPYPKKYVKYKVGGCLREVAQMVEHLPRKHEALSPNSSTRERQRQREQSCLISVNTCIIRIRSKKLNEDAFIQQILLNIFYVIATVLTMERGTNKKVNKCLLDK